MNFLESEREDRIRAAYPGGAHVHCLRVKRRYDPTNLFRLNLSIKPA